MNRLQDVSPRENYFVSINRAEFIDRSRVIRRIEYEHPLFDRAAVAAQADLPRLNRLAVESTRTFFAGSYFRYGFHEDAFSSAVDLAALMLGERIARGALVASLMGLAGVVVIALGRMGGGAPADGWGIALILISSLLYALNLVLQRKQALVAGPAEVSTFHQGVVLLCLVLFAPWFMQRPDTTTVMLGALSAVLSVAGALGFAWAYARAETQALAPLEYSGFLWAALFGWLFFREPVALPTLAGAALIVVGCWIAAPRKRPEQSAL